MYLLEFLIRDSETEVSSGCIVFTDTPLVEILDHAVKYLNHDQKVFGFVIYKVDRLSDTGKIKLSTTKDFYAKVVINSDKLYDKDIPLVNFPKEIRTFIDSARVDEE